MNNRIDNKLKDATTKISAVGRSDSINEKKIIDSIMEGKLRV